MRIIKTLSGILLCFVAFSFTVATEQVDKSAQPFFIVSVCLCVFGAVLLLKKPKRKKVAAEQNSDAAVYAPQKINKKSSSLPPIFSNIPHEIIELLWFYNGPLVNLDDNAIVEDIQSFVYKIDAPNTSEPSAIDITLPIDSRISPSELTEDIGYYPSYKNLSPKHRYIYFKWLEDVTQPVPIGYVFIFYYGLERFLFTDKREKALSMICLLRQCHFNKSFQAYSADAIAMCMVKYGHILDAYNTSDVEKYNPVVMYITGAVNSSFNALELMKTARSWGFTNTNYINGKDGIPDLYFMELCDILVKRFGRESIAVLYSDFECASHTHTCTLANYSLPLKDRMFNIPDIFSNIEYAEYVVDILSEAHERTKVKLRDLRSDYVKLKK